MVMVVVFYCQALYFYIPHLSLILALTFVEGTIGGASYANTFYRIHTKVCLLLFSENSNQNIWIKKWSSQQEWMNWLQFKFRLLLQNWGNFPFHSRHWATVWELRSPLFHRLHCTTIYANSDLWWSKISEWTLKCSLQVILWLGRYSQTH